MICKVCSIQFNQEHFNQKICGNPCKQKSKQTVKRKYKISEKGKIANSKWVKSARRNENEKNYRKKTVAKAKAVSRSMRCLKNNAHLIERKRTRDRIHAKTEIGRDQNNMARAKYIQTEQGRLTAKNAKHRRRTHERRGSIKRSEWLEILKKYRDRCAKCKSDQKIEMDHIIPLSRGGIHHASNVQPLCRSCNAKKGNKIWQS